MGNEGVGSSRCLQEVAKEKELKSPSFHITRELTWPLHEMELKGTLEQKTLLKRHVQLLVRL